MGRALEQAEDELVRNNEELGAMNEELTALDEELRQSNDVLQTNERQIVQKNNDLNILNEELTATQEEQRRNFDELSRAVKTIRESEERYRIVADFTSDWEFWCDPKGRYIYISPSAERVLGRPINRDMLAEPFLREVMHPDDLEARLVHLKNEQAGSGPYDLEFRIVRPDNEVRWLHHVCRPIRDAEGKFRGTRGSNRDITERKNAEKELMRKNEDIRTAYEEIAVKEEELHQNVEKLTRREEELNKALAEKEILLSEIHHRVKNNLTAFISLLSLEGSIEDTPAGKTLKQDLQNRARSMALIHETLYRTHMYHEIDMGMYLTMLIDQIANSFGTKRSVKTVVDAQGVTLDIPRATPAGLIVNELVTNSFKYAFPESFDTQAVRNAPPTITITIAKNEGIYEMTVRDNGIGLPSGFEVTKTQTLGLKLVNFLAMHQMRAKLEVKSAGTEFVFRFME
jgi:PAS domain S-box-containing protein